MSINLKAIDFFCGAGGMSQGFSDAGINVIGALDNDSACQAAHQANHPQTKFLLEDIKKYKVRQLATDIPKLKQDDKSMIFIACSPCQHWTTLRHSREKSAESNDLLKYFCNFVEYYKPAGIVIENVTGIAKNPEESGLSDLLELLKDSGYKYDYRKLSCQFYGVPQKRRRFILIAAKDKEVSIDMIIKDAKKTTVREKLVDTDGCPLPKLKPGERDNKNSLHRTAKLSDTNIKRLKKTAPGKGNIGWRNDPLLAINAYRGNKRFMTNYGRMAWDEPAPTITTKFSSLGCGQFGHPGEIRTISLYEGALLQTFPSDYMFPGNSMQTIARLIGNAVPPELAYRIAKAMKQILGR